MVAGQAVARQVQVAVAGRGNAGEADGAACCPGKDKSLGQQGEQSVGLASFKVKLAASALWVTAGSYEFRSFQ